MDVNIICGLLPEKPRKEMIEEAMASRSHELGPNYALFNREPLMLYPWQQEDMCELLSYEQAEATGENARRVWGALVKCSCCGDDYFAGYHSHPASGVRGIILRHGDYGMMFDGYTDGNSPINEMEIAEGETFQCPLCGEVVELISKRQLRCGRTYCLQVCSVENIGQYTALMFWMISRRIDEYGYWETSVKPYEALVIDEKCRLKRFTHIVKFEGGVSRLLNKWEPRTGFSDSFQSKYYDWPSACHQKIGGVCFSNVPDLTGKTGEKTGLSEYIRAGGEWPAAYLKTQQKYKAVENLMKCGWGTAVVTGINDEVNSLAAYGMRTHTAVEFAWGNRGEVKPTKILDMTKEEIRHGSKWCWNNALMTEWWRYRNTEQHCSAEVFNRYFKTVGLVGVQQTVEMLNQGDEGYELPELMRYFERFPDLKPRDILQYLIDVRTIAAELSPDGKITEEQRWPRNLTEVHDRLDRVQRSLKNTRERQKYADGFKKVYEKYKALEWNDGRLCIRTARTNGELIDEGNRLDHCVGGYGEAHIAEKDVIFFVRRYKRPERSYYTLDIRFTQGAPYEVQLHGYGNERHGPNKKYRHSIPKAVRDFVDRWKTEVLTPWYTENKKNHKRKNLRAG